jgi:two-component system LytT family response regulator
VQSECHQEKRDHAHLIVDDELLARTAIANIVSKRSDIEILDTASDAVEALKKLTRNAYDVLMLEINMAD